jgi:hypothetical protein
LDHGQSLPEWSVNSQWVVTYRSRQAKTPDRFHAVFFRERRAFRHRPFSMTWPWGSMQLIPWRQNALSTAVARNDADFF